MKKSIIIIVIVSMFYCCNKNQTGKNQIGKIILCQPDSITLDTTLGYFSLVKKYIELTKKNDKGINRFILAFYYHENVEELRIKITAIKTFDSFNGRLPNYYFKYKNNLIFVFTGIDMISKFDPIYIKNIKSQFQDNRIGIDAPGCWEIVYNEDTCYYYHSKYPLIPVVQGPKFEGPPYKHSLSQ